MIIFQPFIKLIHEHIMTGLEGNSSRLLLTHSLGVLGSAQYNVVLTVLFFSSFEISLCFRQRGVPTTDQIPDTTEAVNRKNAKQVVPSDMLTTRQLIHDL